MAFKPRLQIDQTRVVKSFVTIAVVAENPVVLPAIPPPPVIPPQINFEPAFGGANPITPVIEPTFDP